MNKTSALRIAIIFEWFSLTLVYLTVVIFHEFLPVTLREYLQWEETRVISGYEKFLSTIYLISLVTCFISSIFLFFLKKPARWVYLACVVIALFIDLFMANPLVLHFIPDIFYGLGSMLTGFILALIFFTDVLDRGPESTEEQKIEESLDPPTVPDE